MGDKCRYSLAWIGACGKDCDGNFCDHHKAQRCVSCGDQSTHECPSAGSLVCGAPLCNNCIHDKNGHRKKEMPTEKPRDGYAPPVVVSEQSPKFVVGDSDKLPIGYIAVAPDDLAELRRKAAAYDAIFEGFQAIADTCDKMAKIWRDAK